MKLQSLVVSSTNNFSSTCDNYISLVEVDILGDHLLHEFFLVVVIVVEAYDEAVFV